MREKQLKNIVRWLTRINFIVPALAGLAAAALVAINYEWPIIIEFLVGVLIFTLTFVIGVILWKYTVGVLLAFGIGVWWAHITRNDDN